MTDTLTIEYTDDPRPLEDEWRELETLPQCSIHQTYDWCRTWSAFSGETALFVIGRFTKGALKGRIAFILPLSVTGLGPLRAARYIGGNFNNLNFGLFHSDFVSRSTPQLMNAVVREMRKTIKGIDLLILDRQPEEWRGLPHPFAQLPLQENQNSSFQVTLNESFDKIVRRGNPKRRRKKFRTSEKRLEPLGGYEYVQAATPEEAGSLLDSFYEQKAARFKSWGIPDVFASDRVRRIFKQLAADAFGKEQKALEMHAIRMKRDGRPIAVSALSVKDGHVICQFSSFAEGETEQASPGDLLFYHMIRNACERGAALFDFGVGDEMFKRNWCDMQTRQYDCIIATSAMGRGGALAMAAMTGAKRLVKGNAQLYSLVRKVRTRLHGESG